MSVLLSFQNKNGIVPNFWWKAVKTRAVLSKFQTCWFRDKRFNVQYKVLLTIKAFFSSFDYNKQNLKIVNYQAEVQVQLNKPKMAYSRDLPKMAVWQYGLKLQ